MLTAYTYIYEYLYGFAYLLTPTAHCIYVHTGLGLKPVLKVLLSDDLPTPVQLLLLSLLQHLLPCLSPGRPALPGKA